MSAMMDATCPCGKRIGWRGDAVDRPACPRCGHRPDQAVLEADDRTLQETMALLTTPPTSATCRRQREIAGLTPGQAAKLLGIIPAQLADYEAGEGTRIPEEIAAKMAEVYGLML